MVATGAEMRVGWPDPKDRRANTFPSTSEVPCVTRYPAPARPAVPARTTVRDNGSMLALEIATVLAAFVSVLLIALAR